MKMATLVRAAGGTILFAALLVVWYNIAADYGYSALAGTYVFHGNVETCTLHLRPDRTFVQEVSRSGVVQRSQGEWDR